MILRVAPEGVGTKLKTLKRWQETKKRYLPANVRYHNKVQSGDVIN